MTCLKYYFKTFLTKLKSHCLGGLPTFLWNGVWNGLTLSPCGSVGEEHPLQLRFSQIVKIDVVFPLTSGGGTEPVTLLPATLRYYIALSQIFVCKWLIVTVFEIGPVSIEGAAAGSHETGSDLLQGNYIVQGKCFFLPLTGLYCHFKCLTTK